MIRIGIDGNLLCGKRTGMGTVVYNVLPYWLSNKEYSITLYLPDELDKDYFEQLLSNRITVKVLGKANYMKWEQIILPRALKKDNIDILWCPYNTAPIKVSCKTVVSINDAIYMTASLSSAPSLYKKMGIIYRKLIVPRAAKKASSVITISDYAKSEIVNAIPSTNGKIQVIYLGADYSGNYLDDNEKERFFKSNGIRKPYILGFGSLESRKNSLSLIKAYNNLSEKIKREYQLVLFGFRGYEGSEQYLYIEKNNLHNLVVLGYVTDREKNTLYKESKMFVFPSLAEGFGIPVLEAFANNTPVITSSTTSIPEVAGDAALLIDPKNVDTITSSINDLINNSLLANQLIAKGVERYRLFDWEKTSSAILKEVIKCGENQ